MTNESGLVIGFTRPLILNNNMKGNTMDSDSRAWFEEFNEEGRKAEPRDLLNLFQDKFSAK